MIFNNWPGGELELKLPEMRPKAQSKISLSSNGKTTKMTGEPALGGYHYSIKVNGQIIEDALAPDFGKALERLNYWHRENTRGNLASFEKTPGNATESPQKNARRKPGKKRLRWRR
jgi:hypothetical protein